MSSRRPRKLWSWLLAAVLVLAVLGASVAFVAWWQAKSVSPETVHDTFPASARTTSDIYSAPFEDSEPLRLHVGLSVAQGLVRPIPAGNELRLEAIFDPSRYQLLRQDSKDENGEALIRVGLEPRGSAPWALLQAKVGGRIPQLLVEIPVDLDLELVVESSRGFVAVELGELRLRGFRLDAYEGGAKVTVSHPTAAAADTFTLRGTLGSLDVSGLGNASPRSTFISHDAGILDLDLRGAWRRDGRVEIDAGVAGGTLWLPSNVQLRRLRENGVDLDREVAEAPAFPVLEVDLPPPTRRLVVIE